MRPALCPGSFDPVTLGHLDIIERAARLFERVLVVVFVNPRKTSLFAPEERVAMLREVTSHLPNVDVDASGGLLSEYAMRVGARVIVKGLRSMADLEAESQMAWMNQQLAPGVETVFLMGSSHYGYLSSSLVKEVALLGGPVDQLVPKVVTERLRERLGGVGAGNSHDARG